MSLAALAEQYKPQLAKGSIAQRDEMFTTKMDLHFLKHNNYFITYPYVKTFINRTKVMRNIEHHTLKAKKTKMHAISSLDECRTAASETGFSPFKHVAQLLNKQTVNSPPTVLIDCDNCCACTEQKNNCQYHNMRYSQCES